MLLWFCFSLPIAMFFYIVSSTYERRKIAYVTTGYISSHHPTRSKVYVGRGYEFDNEKHTGGSFMVGVEL